MSTIDTAEFWRSIRPGSTISLTDKLAIEDSLSRSKGFKGRDYIVEQVRTIRQEDDFAQWLMFKLEDADQQIWLMAKIVDQHVGLLVYYEPDEFKPADRTDLVARGDYWLFQEPSDPNDFFANELNYSREIVWGIDVDGKERDVQYQMKGQRVLYGICTHNPAMVGLEGAMMAVVEYQTHDDDENPELLVLELGGEDNDRGGLISVMFGNTINFSEVEVLNLIEEKETKPKKKPFWGKIVNKISK